MQCIHCHEAKAQKFGKDRKGNQRFKCLECRKTFQKPEAKPLGDMRISMHDAQFALNLLLEGMSIRATERMTGLHRDTLCQLVVTVGENCQRFLKRVNQAVPVKELQCDEMWGFVGMKEKTRQYKKRGEEFGDAYAFVAMERNTKYVVCWKLGKRTAEDTREFIDDLYFATTGRFQISTDGYTPYQFAIPMIFGFGIDFAQLVKKYGGHSDTEGHKRYSPAQIVSASKTFGCGNPDMDRVCTSHVERGNLTMRMQVRRLTRLTNAHSKKWENHEAMLALYFCWYNYVRPHMTLATDEQKKRTPAMAQGMASEVWSIERMLRDVAA